MYISVFYFKTYYILGELWLAKGEERKQGEFWNSLFSVVTKGIFQFEDHIAFHATAPNFCKWRKRFNVKRNDYPCAKQHAILRWVNTQGR